MYDEDYGPPTTPHHAHHWAGYSAGHPPGHLRDGACHDAPGGESKEPRSHRCGDRPNGRRLENLAASCVPVVFFRTAFSMNNRFGCPRGSDRNGKRLG